jgi:hypothetical protein
LRCTGKPAPRNPLLAVPKPGWSQTHPRRAQLIAGFRLFCMCACMPLGHAWRATGAQGRRAVLRVLSHLMPDLQAHNFRRTGAFTSHDNKRRCHHRSNPAAGREVCSSLLVLELPNLRTRVSVKCRGWHLEHRHAGFAHKSQTLQATAFFHRTLDLTPGAAATSLLSTAAALSAGVAKPAHSAAVIVATLYPLDSSSLARASAGPSGCTRAQHGRN